MEKVFILNEEEYSMLQGQAKYIEQLEDECKTLLEINLSMSKDIEWYQRELGRLQKDLGVQAEELRKAKIACEDQELIVTTIRGEVHRLPGFRIEMWGKCPYFVVNDITRDGLTAIPVMQVKEIKPAKKA